MKASPTATDQQRAAIDMRTQSVALSAGAGCGKTFVLSERFLSYLAPHEKSRKPPAELSELVAFTYTERAAREMRSRIRRICSERLATAGDADADYWLDLTRQIDAARISTVHSFCASLLRAHSVEAGLDPNFGVLDPALGDSMRRECLDDVLRERLTAQDLPTLDLVRRYGLNATRDKVAAMLKGRDKREIAAFASLKPEELVARWDTERPAVYRSILEELSRHPSFIDTLSLARSATFPNPELDQKRQLLAEQLPRLASSDDPAALVVQLREATLFGNMRHEKHWGAFICDAPRYKQSLTALRKRLESAHESLAWDAAVALEAATVSLAVLALAVAVEARYSHVKCEQRSLDFDDLLVHTHALLTAPGSDDARREICRHLKLLLVDESQDTNKLQVELITALCGDDGVAGGKLFFVGDFKQSIYRFLGADPRVFHDLRRQIPEPGRLPLSENFRSQPAIVDFVNAVFCDELLEYEPLLATRPQTTPTPTIEFLWSVDPNLSRKGNAHLMRGNEAQSIARRLAELLDSREPLIPEPPTRGDGPPTLRPVRPGDIAILFRALVDVAPYEQALQQLDLPYYLVGGKAFYAQQEVFDLSNLLRVLVQRSDEVSLVGVLRSPFFSLADETIFWLAGRPGGLSAALFSDVVIGNIEAQERQAVRFAAETLRELRAEKDRLPITAIINRALALTGYDASLVAEFMGQRKLANLRKLIEMARTFDESGFATLADFVVQLSEFEASQPDEALAAVHAESSDVIRLMTIHQAKGLEFPVVVIADVDRLPRTVSAPAVFDPQWGPLVPLPVDADRPASATGFDLYMHQINDEEQRERTRLFYVATTRAADYLVLSSSFADPDQPAGPWAKLVAQRFDLVSGAPREPWPEQCRTVDIRVTINPPERDQPVRHAAATGLTALLESIGQSPMPDPGRLRDIAEIAPDTAARRLFSFSRLTGELRGISELSEDPQRPPRDGEGRRDATQAATLGTLIHAILAETPLDDSRDLSSLAARHAERLLIDDPADVSEAIRIIDRFARTTRAGELRKAGEIYRELEFRLAWPPDTDAAQTASPLFQGFIDCLFRDNHGRWHILDYKTHDIPADRVEAEARRYKLQLGLYALASEKVLNQSPATLTLHFLRPGVDASWEWNANMRQHTIERVTELLQSHAASV
jgi:ATP-dependent helicase/nuclease subunit A